MEFVGRNIDCPLCEAPPNRHSVVAERDRVGKPLRTVLCEECGLVFSNPMPTADEVARFYRDDYRREYKGVDRPKPKHVYRGINAAVKRLAAASKFYETGSVCLDLGAGGGEFVYLLSCKGYAAEGVEPNLGYGNYAREVLGATVHQGTFETVELPPGHYDIVSSFHVFEHLIDPVAAFRRVKSWLKPSGRLYIEVPNMDATAQTLRSRFHRGHVVHFTPATLSAMARKAGFALERDFSTPDGRIVRMMLRIDGMAQTVVPSPAAVNRTKEVLAARSPFGDHWVRRNLAKYAGRAAEWMAIRGRDGRAVADAVIARRAM